MKMKTLLLTVALFSAIGLAANAQTLPAQVDNGSNAFDELDPFSPNIQQTLKEMDEDYKNVTGQDAQTLPQFDMFAMTTGGCRALSCEIYVMVDKSKQTLYLYVHGQLQYTWLVSTGVNGRNTPDFDRHPDGRIYDSYTSSKYPGGDYNGMGNMPYAVFIQDGFAIHGTGQGNWRYLGHQASHGCIRLHPDNAKIFNRMVRANGVSQTWVTVR